MNRWAYPIGEFVPTEHPTLEDRKRWIEEIAQMPKMLRSSVQHLTSEKLRTQYRPGGWNVQQVVHHLADNDMHAYIRFKRALTEDSPTASSYHEDLWAELNDYEDTPIEVSLILSRLFTIDLSICFEHYPPININVHL